MIKNFLVAVAALCLATSAFAQTQPAPAAKTTSGNVASLPVSLFVAPAGGAAGLGRVVALDAPLPVTGAVTLDPGIQQTLSDILAALNTPPTSLPPIAPTSDTTLAIAPTPSTAAEACHVFKASAGNLYSVSGYIGAAGFVMVFNATAAPADGAVTPVTWAYAPAAGSWYIDYGVIPQAMSTGIVVCTSSTGPLTKTAYSTNSVMSGRWQ